MMWLLTFVVALDATQWINLCFALVCLALAAGGNGRAAALVSALLYLCLVCI